MNIWRCPVEIWHCLKFLKFSREIKQSRPKNRLNRPDKPFLIETQPGCLTRISPNNRSGLKNVFLQKRFLLSLKAAKCTLIFICTPNKAKQTIQVFLMHFKPVRPYFELFYFSFYLILRWKRLSLHSNHRGSYLGLHSVRSVILPRTPEARLSAKFHFPIFYAAVQVLPEFNFLSGIKSVFSPLDSLSESFFLYRCSLSIIGGLPEEIKSS